MLSILRQCSTIKHLPLYLIQQYTSDMLTNNPDVYLYGTLLEAEPFIMNDERVPLWLAIAFEKAVVTYKTKIIKIVTQVHNSGL